jgi:hypothetical protein
LRIQEILCAATIGAFLAASYYACITKRQLKTMNETLAEVRKQTKSVEIAANAAESAAETASVTLKTSEEVVHLTEVADIELEDIQCSTNPQPFNTNTAILVRWRNNGRTPADKVQTHAFVGIYGGPRPPAGAVSTSTIGPGQPINNQLGVAGLFGPEDLMRINANPPTRRMHIWGWATYDDRFNAHHIVVFNTNYAQNTPWLFGLDAEISRSHSEHQK